MIKLLIILLAVQSGESASDSTVLATALRLFHDGNPEMASSMISEHSWEVDSLRRRAGLVMELCAREWLLGLEEFPQTMPKAVSLVFRVSIEGEWPAGDSIALYVPVPLELSWQRVTGFSHSFSGIEGEAGHLPGWLSVSGLSLGNVSVTVSADVTISIEGLPVVSHPDTENALVFFSGEEPEMDVWLDKDCFWAGGAAVYMAAVRLASGEPNPVRLAGRVAAETAAFYAGNDPLDHRYLFTPIADLALSGGVRNSAAGAFLGASYLRRWGIPAAVLPGAWGQGQHRGYVLAVHIKPFGWMAVSPWPEDFIATGTLEPPVLRSWASGFPGLTHLAEGKSAGGQWHGVPFDEHFAGTVEISPR